MAWGATAPRGQRQRDDQVPLPGGVARIDDDWQVGHILENGDPTQIERGTCGGFEGADPVFAQQHLLIASGEQELGGIEQLLERRGSTATKDHRPVHAPQFTQQAVVLHILVADHQDIGQFGRLFDIGGHEHFGDDRQIVESPGLGEHLEARAAQPGIARGVVRGWKQPPLRIRPPHSRT